MRTLLQRLEPHYQNIALGTTLALALALCFGAWDAARSGADAKARESFEARARQIESAVVVRMFDYEQVLRGALALLQATDSVKRDEWRTYYETLRLEQFYPGIQGIGVARVLRPDQLADHEAAVQAEGYSDYVVHPRGKRSIYTSVVYIEPFRSKNLRAFGYDMYSEPVRRAAMERARDRADAAMTAKVTLVQDGTDGEQAGVLLYLPIFTRGQYPVTPAQRRRALEGWVYAAFRAKSLMDGILGSVSDVRVELFDGTDAGKNLLYDSESGNPQGEARDPVFEVISTFIVHGRPWTLRTTSLPMLEKDIDRARERLVLVLGLTVSLMLTALVRLLVTTRERAISLARGMTRELRSSREQIGLALEGSNLALFDWNLASGRVELSERWNVMLGGGPIPTVTTIEDLSKLVHPDDVQRLRKELRAMLSGNARQYQVEHRVRVHGGDWKWIAGNAKVVERDAEGRALRVTGTNADISDRKAMDQMKREFIATVSHELRTPLAAIIGSLGLLREEAADKLPADVLPFLDMAIQNGDRLALLVNDILDIEKIEAGALELKLEPLRLKTVLRRAVELNGPYAQHFGVTFELEEDAADATVLADEQRMMQVLTNLLSNAAKFSPAGESVMVGAVLDRDTVRISVSDRGPGIPEAFQPRIFGKFAQADGSNTRSKGGTGLGLAITKALVEGMHGRIGFDSRSGEGTTFWAEFKVCRDGQP